MSDQLKPATDATVDLLYALMHGGRMAEARIDAALEEIGLSALKWLVLKQLVDSGGTLTLGQAADLLACAKSNVTQLVDRLERDGLVQRVPDRLDRRSIFAQITDEGRRRYRAGLRALGALESQLDSALTSVERDQLARSLQRLDGGTAHQRD